MSFNIVIECIQPNKNNTDYKQSTNHVCLMRWFAERKKITTWILYSHSRTFAIGIRTHIFLTADHTFSEPDIRVHAQIALIYSVVRKGCKNLLAVMIHISHVNLFAWTHRHINYSHTHIQRISHHADTMNIGEKLFGSLRTATNWIASFSSSDFVRINR